jgi:hypothetical protein
MTLTTLCFFRGEKMIEELFIPAIIIPPPERF